jgi:threonine dehydratase
MSLLPSELQDDPDQAPDGIAIAAAATRIAPWIRRTPLLSLTLAGQRIELKLECLQVSGTFKARGAFTRLLRARERALALDINVPERVVAASGGNHGIAVAMAAQQLGWSADIFVPRTAPAAKQARLRALGAQVHAVGEEYAQALAASQEFIKNTGALSSHAYDQYDTLAGQGTVAREWLEQANPADQWLVAVGGGGLIGGMAAWLNEASGPGEHSHPRVLPELIAVESEGCPTLHAALQAGQPVDIQPTGLAADALGARRIGQQVFALRERIARAVLVPDADIAAAQAWLWQEARIATEPGGATALAAVLGGHVRAQPGQRIGVLVCGANVDPTRLASPPAE